MNEPKYTPGPWYVYRCGRAHDGDACGITTEKDGGRHRTPDVVKDTNYDECRHMMDINDAKLVAASPDMYEAIRQILVWWEKVVTGKREEKSDDFVKLLCRLAASLPKFEEIKDGAVGLEALLGQKDASPDAIPEDKDK